MNVEEWRRDQDAALTELAGPPRMTLKDVADRFYEAQTGQDVSAVSWIKLRTPDDVRATNGLPGGSMVPYVLDWDPAKPIDVAGTVRSIIRKNADGTFRIELVSTP